MEERLEEAMREKERLKSELNYEIERLTKTHQETVNLLRDDNRELEKRYFDELSEKRRDNEVVSGRERQYMTEIDDLRKEVFSLTATKNPSKSKRSLDSDKKAPRNKKPSVKKSARGFNSDTEDDTFIAARDTSDRTRLYEMDLQDKNAKIMQLRGTINCNY